MGFNSGFKGLIFLPFTRRRNAQNNWKSRQCRNKIFCVGCTDRTLTVIVFLYSFVSLRCVMPVSVRHLLCLVKFRLKVLQNGRLDRFSKRTGCWCAFSWCLVCWCHGWVETAFQLIHDISRQQLGWILPEAVNTVKCSLEDGRKHRPKHVELTSYNKLTYIVASCWLLA